MVMLKWVVKLLKHVKTCLIKHRANYDSKNSCLALTVQSWSVTEFNLLHMGLTFLQSNSSKKLERVQERALRAEFSNKTVMNEQLLELAKLPSLENRRILDILILVPKTMTDFFPISNRKNNFNKDNSIPRVSPTKYGKHSIRYL